jgi:hypothetical protein
MHSQPVNPSLLTVESVLRLVHIPQERSENARAVTAHSQGLPLSVYSWRRKRAAMGSDNIFDQVEALIASDERQQLPESADVILKAIAKLP